MGRWLAALVCLLMMGSGMGAELTVMDQKRVELMTSQQRTQYLDIAFGNSAQGKAIPINVNGQAQLSPGIYQWIDGAGTGTLTYTAPGTGLSYNLGQAGPFALTTLQTIQAAGTNVTLAYFPNTAGTWGVPLIRQAVAIAATISIVIPFAGNWSVIETDAADAFVRSLTGSGPLQLIIGTVAGHKFMISQTALL